MRARANRQLNLIGATHAEREGYMTQIGGGGAVKANRNRVRDNDQHADALVAAASSSAPPEPTVVAPALPTGLRKFDLEQ